MKNIQNRIKLLMSYNNSKTLTENKEIILEQTVDSGKITEVSKNIRYWLTGDVQSKDLNKIHDELKTKIFGKTFAKGGCALSKLIEYFEKDTKGVNAWDIFGTTALLTLGISEWFKSSNLRTQIENSSEGSEGGFEDIKESLLSDIDKELSGFCTSKSQQTTVNKKASLDDL